MAKVVLVNSNQMKPAVAPVALDYLAESLNSAGHEAAILDLCFSNDWKADIRQYFASNNADLVGLTIRNTDDCYFASQDFFIPFFKEVVDSIRTNTDCPIILGGAGLSVAAKAVMEYTGADFAAVGDGEFVLPTLASNLESQQSIPGLVYRTVEGIRANSPLWMDMADLPIRTRRWLDNKRYFAEGGQAGIETKRGCNGKCIYCADPVGKGFTSRLRPPEHIIKEIRALLDQGVNCFHICDSEFNIPLSHAKSVCEEIIASDTAGKFRWYTYASPAPFTDELARLMKHAGCEGIDFGVDSGDDEVLRALGRIFTSEDVVRTAEICRRHGITFMYDLMIGGPSETFESVERTINLMKQINPMRVGISVGIRIYEGTPIGNLARKQGINTSNKNLHGAITNNEDFLMPIYYLSENVGIQVFDFISGMVSGDHRFLHASIEEIEGNYNYNDNTVLVDAIKNGHKGAYWDILRRVQENLPPISI